LKVGVQVRERLPGKTFSSAYGEVRVKAWGVVASGERGKGGGAQAWCCAVGSADARR